MSSAYFATELDRRTRRLIISTAAEKDIQKCGAKRLGRGAARDEQRLLRH
ncbi:MAG: hypothetical protein ACLGHI_02860 [Gammaproteobacteria bacterium]